VEQENLSQIKTLNGQEIVEILASTPNLGADNPLFLWNLQIRTIEIANTLDHDNTYNLLACFAAQGVKHNQLAAALASHAAKIFRGIGTKGEFYTMHLNLQALQQGPNS
jgi:hypothetical protein